MTYNTVYQSLTGNTSPTVGDALYYDNNGSMVATGWVILDLYSNNDIRYKKNQSGWSASQQKERGIGWTGSGWTEDPWSLSGDKEPDLLSNDGTFASASATCTDATTISTWTTGGASYAEGSFLSPFFTSSSGGGTSTEGVATVGDAVGSLVDYPSFSEINANITAESPGGSNYSYTVLKDNVQIAQMNTHSNGTATSFDVDYSTVGRFGVWDFTVMEVSTVTVRHLARLTIVDPNARKNVFRNFW